uniref:Uncharacterized protein n=1 Tax=Branchiostoma floridae TaxID=7739 RepID=C3YLK3_BRAFL|eukprot:XP_002602760.1 hypothetical protein BRAFLDRAFT_127112 [Branchiostoma floridae]
MDGEVPQFYVEEVSERDLDALLRPWEAETEPEQQPEPEGAAENTTARFATLDGEQLDEIEGGRVEKTTEKSTRWGVKIFKELAVVMARVNAKIRTNGLSSREYLQQRDQFSGEQLPMSDRTLLKEQHHRRRSNHKPSIKSKSPRTKAHATTPSIAVGDLVYLNTDRDKTKGRNRYLVTNVEQNWIHVSKFTGHQLRSKSYKVRPNQCYLVPNQVTLQNRRPTHDEADSDTTDTDEVRPCPEVTDLPVPDPPPDFLVPPDPPPVPEPPPAAEPHLQPATPEPHPPPRHSKRTVRPPPYLQDYVM